jgi:hypothetical protein
MSVYLNLSLYPGVPVPTTVAGVEVSTGLPLVGTPVLHEPFGLPALTAAPASLALHAPTAPPAELPPVPTVVLPAAPPVAATPPDPTLPPVPWLPPEAAPPLPGPSLVDGLEAPPVPKIPAAPPVPSLVALEPPHPTNRTTPTTMPPIARIEKAYHGGKRCSWCRALSYAWRT